MTQRPLAEDVFGNAIVILFPIGSSEVDDATDDRLTGGNGSIRAQSDDLGEISGTADYDVWGTELSSSTGSLFTWTGEQNGDETGLTYLRARYYSPTQRRSLSTDPVQPNAGGSQGFNAYARNNPAKLTDPSRTCLVRDLPG